MLSFCSGESQNLWFWSSGSMDLRFRKYSFQGNLVFRGMVDSTWTVGAVMEKRLAPLPFTFCMSAMLNHAKGSSRLGLGLIVG